MDKVEYYMVHEKERLEIRIHPFQPLKSIDINGQRASTHHILQHFRYLGTAEIMKEAPLIYRCSKINLNISLKSILTGIPLRAFEIMGSGGFLASNYQEDFLEFFRPDEDFICSPIAFHKTGFFSLYM